MKTKINAQRGREYNRRKGYALVMALVVIAIGAALSTFLISMGYAFLKQTTHQRTFYGNHISVTDWIQRVKGDLVSHNNSAGEVLHGRGLTNGFYSPISSLSDLALQDDSKYSFDVAVEPWGMGNQRIVINVYDISFYYDQLQSSITGNPVVMRNFPSPVNVLAGSSSSEMDSEGTAVAPDTTDPSKSKGVIPWENFAAYVIRADLYDTALGRRRLVRRAEEAFFQVLSSDASP